MTYPIVVLISGNGSNLQAIIDQCHKRGIVDIRTVISDQAEAYGLVRAEKAEIRPVVVPQWHFERREDYCQILADTINIFEPKLVVLAGFMKILTPGYFDRVCARTINIHPSLLPKYKGLNTHRRVLDSDDLEHGITIHWATEDLDAGPIIHQSRITVLKNDNAMSLEKRIHELEHQWYPHVINLIANTDRETYESIRT